MLYVNPLSPGDPAQIGANADPKQRQKIALRELEHLFLFTLLQEMRKTVSIIEESEGGQERDLYSEMLDDALSGQMAASGQMGIAKQVEEQLRAAETQEAVSRTLAERESDRKQAAPVKGFGVASDK